MDNKIESIIRRSSMRGIMPALLGTAITGATIYRSGGDVMKKGKKKRHMDTMVASGLLGFGVASVLVGSMSMMKK